MDGFARLSVHELAFHAGKVTWNTAPRGRRAKWFRQFMNRASGLKRAG